MSPNDNDNTITENLALSGTAQNTNAVNCNVSLCKEVGSLGYLVTNLVKNFVTNLVMNLVNLRIW